MKFFDSEFKRFVFWGAVNTGLTYFCYIFFALFVNYKIAYTVSYILGILISYYCNVRFSFQESFSVRQFIPYPLVYVMQYGVGLLLVYSLVDLTGINKFIAPIIVLVLTVPLTFFMSRMLIKREFLWNR